MTVIVSLPEEALRRRRARRGWGLVLFYGSCVLVGLGIGWAVGSRV